MDRRCRADLSVVDKQGAIQVTFEVILPYLIAGAAGWAVRHLDLLQKLKTALAGPHPVVPASPGPASAHPVLDVIRADVSAVTSSVGKQWPRIFDPSTPHP